MCMKLKLFKRESFINCRWKGSGFCFFSWVRKGNLYEYIHCISKIRYMKNKDMILILFYQLTWRVRISHRHLHVIPNSITNQW